MRMSIVLHDSWYTETLLMAIDGWISIRKSLYFHESFFKKIKQLHISKHLLKLLKGNTVLSLVQLKQFPIASHILL